ncbi:MAG: Fe-S cluster assembly ATPase SufC [Lachnospiraceae bacterium]|nr:Fe-S cluster assembly ATPase SufC [Lachnospiraceae bacterium]
MSEEILKIENLSVQVGDKEILRGVDLCVRKGETHVLMGPNGAGKSTLGNTLMGHPNYVVTGGSVTFKGQNLLEMDVNERAKSGLFLSFQTPIEVPGISLSNFIRNSLDVKTGEKMRLLPFRRKLMEKMDILDMNVSYAERDLNVGFSGGEKKKAEILQMLMLNPDLAILDETDSGLDVDAVRTVSRGVSSFHDSGEGAMIIITHSTKILEALQVDHAHVLVDGRIVANGGRELVDEINENGFEKYLK